MSAPIAPIEYTRVREIRGPLLVVADVEGVGWDEVGEIRLGSGEVRHGVVIEVERDLAVVIHRNRRPPEPLREFVASVLF